MFVAKGNVGETLPLTSGQLAIWAGQQLAPEDPLYNMVLSFRILGPVDTNRFKAAFDALVARCDAFRIVFVEQSGVPRQRFIPRLHYELPIIDLSAESEPDQALDAWIHERRTRMLVTTEPMFDSALLQTGPEEFTWYLNQHHLITDAWAVSVIYRQMRDLYQAAGNGALESVPAMPGFEDHVRDERGRTQSPRRKKAVAFWKQQVHGRHSQSRFYRTAPSLLRGETHRVAVPIGENRSARIGAMSRMPEFRAFTADLAKFQIFATTLFAFLYRVGGLRELAIGTPSHGRRTTRSKEVAGLFIELFPLMVNLDEGETFLSLYQKVARHTRELLANAEPGASTREISRSFDVVLNYITASFGDFAGFPMESEWVHSGFGDRNHVLRMQVHDFDQSDEISLFLDLNVEAFVGDERDRAVRHLLCLLDAFLDDPEAEIDQPEIVDESEREWLVETLNASPENVLESTTVVDLLAQQARATPNEIALVSGRTTMTYSELDKSAAALAAQLGTRGAGPGFAVAIVARRSIDAIVAMIGVLKAGAAYVPVDPAYPKERTSRVLQDAGVLLVLTDADSRDQIPELDLPIEEARDLITARVAGAAQPVEVASDSTAYMIYTSGSTGQPKGVVISHESLANYAIWCRDFYLQGETLDFPLFSSLAFDLTVTSVFVPLISGGRLVIYPESDREMAIRQVIEDNAVDIIKLTPSHLALIQSMDFAGSRLKKLIVGGEDLKTDLARAVLQKFDGQLEIYNEYGPTEGTVACMIHRYDPASDVQLSVPIGRSIDNVQVYVLDSHCRPVPTGVVGEVFIGGLGVARGYLNQPGPTAERFIPDPFHSGGTLYRTGDLGRWTDAGVMEFLGRDDEQVKVRGVRVELGEIETALSEYPDITACVAGLVLRQERQPEALSHDFCVKCGLEASHPSAQLDDERICRICHVYARERNEAQRYFRTMDDLRALIPAMKATGNGKHDCVMLLSGGKDSSYALCQLVDLGLRPLVFTLNNGFISEGALDNIRRIVDHLELELVIGKTSAMNAIFADSLQRFSNVCEGCFKTIYTLSTNLAVERDIGHIVTGLSRGQIFDTRIANIFHQGVFDPETVDRMIVDARKAYHRIDDAVSRHLDVEVFREDAVFDQVRFVDFYRYCDVSLDAVLEYLRTRANWTRPADTGRSTNCLINEAGIYVHKKERGYHNYAAPYSWDVRLGHKDRDAARDELDDRINIGNVERILTEVGYTPKQVSDATIESRFLVCWYVAPREIPSDALKAWLAERLPTELVPQYFLRIDSIPLTTNGKVDRDALPQPSLSRSDHSHEYVAPGTDTESKLVRVWSDVLCIGRIGVLDNFFDLGGDSILSVQIVARARKEGLVLDPQDVFDRPTIRELAEIAAERQNAIAEQEAVVGQVALTPLQAVFLKASPEHVEDSCQMLVLESRTRIEKKRLAEAWRILVNHHDALRGRFVCVGDKWQQHIEAPRETGLEIIQAAGEMSSELEQALGQLSLDLRRRLAPEQGDIVRVGRLDSPDGSSRIVVVIHSLVIDAASWRILLEDMETVLGQLERGVPVSLPAKTTSIRQWVAALEVYANAGAAARAAEYWRDLRSKTASTSDSQVSELNELRQALTSTLDREHTHRLLHELPALFRAQVMDVLLTALSRSAYSAPGGPLTIDVEGHGRAQVGDVDLTRTVGAFATIFPLRLSVDATNEPAEDLQSVREQIRRLPGGGMDYGLAKLTPRTAPDILFRYTGQWESSLASSSPFRLLGPPTDTTASASFLKYPLVITAVIFEGELQVTATYEKSILASETVEVLLERFIAELEALVSTPSLQEDVSLTPSDFPSAGLSQSDLDELIEEFAEGD